MRMRAPPPHPPLPFCLPRSSHQSHQPRNHKTRPPDQIFSFLHSFSTRHPRILNNFLILFLFSIRRLIFRHDRYRSSLMFFRILILTTSFDPRLALSSVSFFIAFFPFTFFLSRLQTCLTQVTSFSSSILSNFGSALSSFNLPLLDTKTSSRIITWYA